jgi:hypothetical protein
MPLFLVIIPRAMPFIFWQDRRIFLCTHRKSAKWLRSYFGRTILPHGFKQACLADDLSQKYRCYRSDTQIRVS